MRRVAVQNVLGFLARRPDVTLTYSGLDLAATSLAAAVVGAWAGAAGGSFSLLALVACEAVFLAFYLGVTEADPDSADPVARTPPG